MGTQTPLRAVAFDACGRLFDVYSVGLLAERLFTGRGNALGVLWRYLVRLPTPWVNHQGLPIGRLDTEPTHSATSLRDVLGFFPS